jgi:hypothetical protein
MNEEIEKMKSMGYRWGGVKPRGRGFSVFFHKGEIGAIQIYRFPKSKIKKHVKLLEEKSTK